MAKDKSVADSGGLRQKSFFQFVTTPTADTPGTLLMLHFDSRRYFFGRMAEGTQRACMQRGVGIKKVRNLFLTGPTTWETIGGLIGFILTTADVQADEIDATTGKRPALSLYGGPKLTHSMACARRFVFRTGMPLRINEADANNAQLLAKPNYSDENINVWSIPVKRRGRSGTSSPRLPNGRSGSPSTVGREQGLRAETVQNMFDSDWRKDRLVESRFDEVKLPALIWTRDPSTKELKSVQCAAMSDAPHLQPESRVLVRNPWPASMVEELPPVNNIAGSVAMSYVVKTLPQRGKFLPAKAKDLGIKPGPNYALLTAGGSVTLDDGRVITSDMVLGPTESGKGMAIFDVPSDEYIEDLSEKIEDIKNEAMSGIESVSWILGSGVFRSPSFAQLIKSLPDLQHFISSPDTGPNYLAFDSAAASGIRLAQIRRECFVIPVHDNTPLNIQSLILDTPHTLAQRGLIVQMTPQFALKDIEVPPLLDVEETKASYSEILKPLLPQEAEVTDLQTPHGNVKILTLGTGSAVPSKYRNVSATLVRIPGLGSYLFDCGENTLGMLRRAFTPSELDDVLVNLRMLWISHLHADHQLGTLSVIVAKQEVMQRLGQTGPQLYVIAEPNMADYLRDFNSVQSVASCELLGVMNSELKLKSGPNVGALTDISRTTLPIKEFLTTRVSHCHGAQACSITFSNGFKFSYSGDCRPSAQFAKIGRDSDVLLHEATFDDGMEGDAMAKKHSTTAEALGVAHAMKAKNVILTHFSQRYQKIPVLNNVKFGEIRFEEGDDATEAGPIQEEEPTPAQVVDRAPSEPQKTGVDLPATSSIKAEDDSMANLQQIAQEMNVCVAFDLMSVTVAQIRDMYKYYPAIEKMFELEQEKSEAKRDMRREEGERAQIEKAGAQRPKSGTNPAVKKSKPATPATATPKGNGSSGDIYSRINRNKPKQQKETDGSNTSTATPPAGATASTTPIKSSTTTTTTTSSPVNFSSSMASPLSKRAQKRSLRRAEAERERELEKEKESVDDDGDRGKRVKLDE